MKIFAIDETPPPESSAERIYADGIPAFAEHSLDRLYGSLYASMPQLQCNRPAQVNTYAAWQGEELSALLLYCEDGTQVRVMNEGMHVPPEELDRFARTLFGRHDKVSVIRLHALSVSEEPLQYPSVCMPVTEDIVIDLPDTEPGYLAQLGKSSRKSLRQNLLRAQKALPGFHHVVMAGETISDGLVDQIISFNHARMAGKQRASAIDADARAHLMNLLRSRGWVGIIRTDERICAGTLACRFGDDVYSVVNAHDPLFDDYSLGNLSRHLMINESIRAGVRRFHLLGGQFSTKRHTLAHRQALCEVRLYRSRLGMLRDTFSLLGLARDSAIYRLRTLLEDARLQPQRGLITRLVWRLQKTLRTIRNSLNGKLPTG